jgi:hypothetical protein
MFSPISRTVPPSIVITRRAPCPSSTTDSPTTSAVIVTFRLIVSVEFTSYVPVSSRITSALPATALSSSANELTVTLLSPRPCV